MLFVQFLKRNILLYFRDRASVFFSFLSTIIVLAIMIAFLGQANVSTTLGVLGVDQTGEHLRASCLIIRWTVAGIIVVNAVSVSMTLVGLMVRDEETDTMSAFLVAPVKRAVYVTGYVVAAVLVALLMCILTFVLGELYIYCIGGDIVTAKEACEVILIIFSIIFSSAAFVFLCAAFVHTSSAYGGLTTVIGSLMGFLAAIYVPYGGMPDMLQDIIRFVPAFQGSSAIREVMMRREIQWFGCDDAVKNGYSEYMGLVVRYGDHTVSSMGKVLYLFAAGFVLLGIAIFALNRKKQAER